MKRFSSLAIVMLALAGLVHAQEPVSAPLEFSIDPQPMPQALKEFARQSGYQVFFQSELAKGMEAPAVVGKIAPEAALEQLLAGSGLSYRLVNARTVAIRVAEERETEAKPQASIAASGDALRIAQAETASTDGADSSSAGQGTETGAAESQQDPQGNLEEILVTAQKRIERRQDVPVAVSAIDAQTLTDNNLVRLEDYYSRLPGVGLTLVGSGSEPMIVIRGMTTFVGGNPTAGVVIDEVSYLRSNALGSAVTMPDIDPGDLQRVEILRGPQGTLYGAANIGGLLKFVTVDPSTQGLSGRLQVGSTYVEKGNDVGRSVRGSVNVPLNDTFAVRLSGFTLHDPGYIDNPETGERDINDRDSEGGRVAALWRPSENFSLKLNAMLQDSERGGLSDSAVGLEPDLARSVLRGIGGTQRKTNAYSATLTGDLGPMELVSATGYSIDELRNSFEFTSAFLVGQANTRFPGTGRVPSFGRFEDRKFTQELRATLPMGERLSWLFGLYYTEEDHESAISIYASDSTAVPVGLLVRNANVSPTTFEERAVFTNLTVNITDRLDVQFGGRYSENDQEFSHANVLLGTNPLDAAPNFFEESRSKDSAFTYLVTPRFRVSPDLMTYIRVASGYRPGGPNFNCGLLPPELCEFDADTSINYEIGVKGTLWDRRLSFDTAVYRIDWKDMQVGPLFTPGFLAYLTNASRARAQGIELSLETKPWTGMNLSMALSYNDAELAEPMPAQFGSGGTFVAQGTQLPFSAPWTGNISADQQFPLAMWDGARGTVGVTVSYVDERQGRFPSPIGTVNPLPLRPKPSYVQIDLHGGVTYDTWQLNAFVNNLADKRGVLRGGDDAIALNTVNYIQPRTFGLSLSKDF